MRNTEEEKGDDQVVIVHVVKQHELHMGTKMERRWNGLTLVSMHVCCFPTERRAKACELKWTRPPAVRGRRKERPKEELRVLSKSPAPIMPQKSKERRLRQKSLEQSVQIGK